MFVMIFRKLWSNKWMFLCLLLGAILAVGMVTSIPMYTEGVLNRMLRRDLERFQESTGLYPGGMTFGMNARLYEEDLRANNFTWFDREVALRAANTPLPVRNITKTLQLSWMRCRRADVGEEDEGRSAIFYAMQGIEEHITLVSGRTPAARPVDGVIEVMISKKLMHGSDFVPEVVYDLADTRTRGEGENGPTYTYDRQFKIVGVFEVASEADTFWPDKGKTAEKYLVPNYDYALAELVPGTKSHLLEAQWYVAYDYQQVKIDTLPTFTADLEAAMAWYAGYRVGSAKVPALELMQGFNNREQTLRTMLMVMQVPILIMLAFYIFMVTQLILASEKGEIAVLKSRGASRGQIMLIYLAESLFVAGVALIAGPPLGYGLCKLLGASNGFLEFVSRRALPVEVGPAALRFALAAAAFIIVMMLVPAFFASKVGIVEQKRRKARGSMALWKKTGVDFILLGVAVYGWFAYQQRQSTLAATGGASVEVPVDPLLFLLSTAFILGIGLLFLRVYPLLVRGVYALGRRLWGPALYASFVQVGRSGGQEQFLMLFLIITLSLGIFSANSANTINLNVEEKIYYLNGADIVTTPKWRSNTSSEALQNQTAETTERDLVDDSAQGYANENYLVYIEPPYETYAGLEGVESATRVFVKDGAALRRPGKASETVQLMAVEPVEFGKTAFMPNKLLKPHWYDYLNLLAGQSGGALISRACAEAGGIKPGDSINVNWSEQNPVSLTVLAVIDYWPTYNPLGSQPGLVVCNLSRVRAQTAIEPYQVWYRRAEGVTSAAIYEQITERKLNLSGIVDSSQMLIEAKNDPMLQGTNGALTMSFIVTMIVSFFGFIIYWVLSIRSRVLQFGVLRAMGMSLRSIIGMLLFEQLLISGVAILFGIVLGGITAQVYTPLLQMVYDAVDQVPPFRVVANRADYEKIYGIILAMLGIGFTVLGVLVSRIRIAQALKLGED